MRRKTWSVAAAVVLVLAIVVGGVVVASGGREATSAAQEPPVSTATVERGMLSDSLSQAGILAFRAWPNGSPYSAINHASGIYTELPNDGDEIDCGDVLYRVDDDPVLLLCGRIPAYRNLGEGDEGNDVRQLNRSLHTLGYDDAAGAAIDPGDDHFTWQTKQALKQLQGDRGSDVNGALAVYDAVFLPGSVRIAKVTGELGGSARPGAPVLSATSNTPEVQMDLDPSQQDALKKGDRAQIALPDNTSVTGKVDRLGAVARAPAGQDGNAGPVTIPAYVSLDDPEKARGLDQVPVQVEIATKGVKSALSVPVTALVGKAGGGFAVEVVRDGGRRELVAVKLGLFDTAAGRVQVDGALRAGDRVVVPSP